MNPLEMAKLRLAVALSYVLSVCLFVNEYVNHSFTIPNVSQPRFPRNEQALFALLHSVPFLLNPLAVLFGFPKVLFVYFFYLCFRAYVLASDWWLPYLFGIEGKFLKPNPEYSEYYGRMIKVLPQGKGLTPDIYTTLFSAVLFVALLVTVKALFSVCTSKDVKETPKKEKKKTM